MRCGTQGNACAALTFHRPRFGVTAHHFCCSAPLLETERIAFVLIDGVGDVTIPQLGNRTPLEAADVPHLDAIAGL